MNLINRNSLKEEMNKRKLTASQVIRACNLEIKLVSYSRKLNGHQQFSEEQCAKLIREFGTAIIDKS